MSQMDKTMTSGAFGLPYSLPPLVTGAASGAFDYLIMKTRETGEKFRF